MNLETDVAETVVRIRDDHGNTGEFKLADYPAQYIVDLLDEVCGDIDSVVAELEECRLHPGNCPLQFSGMRRKLLAPYQLSDWPLAFRDGCCEDMLSGLSNEAAIEALVEHWPEMRFGTYIDLNIQHGYYLHLGNGQITQPEGSDSGNLVGVSSNPAVWISNRGDADWWTEEGEEHYVSEGREKFRWICENAVGPWMLSAEYESGKWDGFYMLAVAFLNADDEKAFHARWKAA